MSGDKRGCRSADSFLTAWVTADRVAIMDVTSAMGLVVDGRGWSLR